MLIHQGTTFARAGSLLQARPILLDEIALRYPELRIVIAHMGHPWFDEAIAVVRRHPHVYADVSALVGRRWLLYQALVAAVEYRVEHKLLFGTDFPFFTATPDDRRAAIRCRRRLRCRDADHRPGRDRGDHPPTVARATRYRLTPASSSSSPSPSGRARRCSPRAPAPRVAGRSGARPCRRRSRLPARSPRRRSGGA